MSFEVWLLYVAAIFFVILIPGPLSLFMVTNSINYGIGKTVPAFLGGVLASTTLIIASALGLGAIIVASDSVFTALKIAGALYLIYLGVGSWRDSAAEQDSELDMSTDARRATAKYMFTRAFTLGASNPKDILFFIAFLPQFIDPAQAILGQLSVIVATWFVVDFICKLLYGSTSTLIKPYLTTGKNKARFDRFTGVLFIAAGLSAALL
ncbi:Homoserine/homoserine lactone efflux protein [Sinobacterium norvegicum]|uniref:Homoserine/homoserine lactone efflux protein n=1 Tax=Sinobacterium norvegicum TaxID=1641715 RepID=A0ABM9ADM7_9GAMM|nr:LysE family translocator [Sinobacterium norvegicum]CAH0991278.1 Homoserine/homoserine lactone efflux protein [Sinobacterium norvegicum]